MSACTLTVTKLLLTPVFWNLSLYVCFYPDQASVDIWLLKPVPLCLPVPVPWPSFCWHLTSETCPFMSACTLTKLLLTSDFWNLSLYVCLYPDQASVDIWLLKPVTLCLPVPWPSFCWHLTSETCPFMSACTLTVTGLLLTPVFWSCPFMSACVPVPWPTFCWHLSSEFVPLCLPVPWPWPASCWHLSSETCHFMSACTLTKLLFRLPLLDFYSGLKRGVLTLCPSLSLVSYTRFWLLSTSPSSPVSFIHWFRVTVSVFSSSVFLFTPHCAIFLSLISIFTSDFSHVASFLAASYWQS